MQLHNGGIFDRYYGSAIFRYIPWMMMVLLLLMFFIRTTNAISYDELHIGGIFPIAGKGGWQGGQACMPAARLALEDVNNKNNILPGYKLILHSNDSEVST